MLSTRADVLTFSLDDQTRVYAANRRYAFQLYESLVLQRHQLWRTGVKVGRWTAAAMSAHSKRRGLVLAGLAVILVVAILSTRSVPLATANAIEMTFVGYTNPPSNFGRFAVLSVSNRAGYRIVWRGDWVEVQGSSEHRAKVVNPNLPGYKRNPVLNAGESIKLAVGQPFYAPETGSWRFCMSFSRYSFRERWLNFSFRHKLPFKLGPIVLVDDQRILSPTNRVTVSTEWLTN